MKVDQKAPTLPTRAVIHHVEHFQHRVVQDAVTDATADYWMRRAEQFEWAKSRPGERLGSERTIEQRAANDRRLDEIAETCRLKATSLINRWEAA